MSSCFMRHRQRRPLAKQGVDHASGNVHVRDGIAELVRLGPLDLGGALADDAVRMPAGARFLQLR